MTNCNLFYLQADHEGKGPCDSTFATNDGLKTLTELLNEGILMYFLQVLFYI